MKNNRFCVPRTKSFAFVLACMLVLSACRSNTGQTIGTQRESNASSQTSASFSESESSASEEQQEVAYAAPDISEAYQKKVQSVLEGMRDFPYGTSGSSLKVAQLVGQWMELFASAEFDAHWVGQKVAEMAKTLDEGRRERFEDLWKDISETVAGWLSAAPEALALIKDAGVEFSGELINADVWKNIQNEIDGALKK